MKFKAKKDKNFRTLTVGLKTQLCKECEEMGRRFCEVDGKPAVFHRWVDEDKALLKINCFVSPTEQDFLLRRFRADSVMPPETSAEIVRQTFALVEYADGTVCKVEPEKVKFTDRRPANYQSTTKSL